MSRSAAGALLRHATSLLLRRAAREARARGRAATARLWRGAVVAPSQRLRRLRLRWAPAAEAELRTAARAAARVAARAAARATAP
eukprot:scaffold1031_cov66-Phaeocystis_antarctica.AAC.4